MLRLLLAGVGATAGADGGAVAGSGPGLAGNPPAAALNAHGELHSASHSARLAQTEQRNRARAAARAVESLRSGD